MEAQKIFLYVLVAIVLLIVVLIGFTRKRAGKTEE